MGEAALARNDRVEPAPAPAALNELARVWASAGVSVTAGAVAATLDLELMRWLDERPRFERELELWTVGLLFVAAKRRRELAARAALRVDGDNLVDGLELRVVADGRVSRRTWTRRSGLAHPTFARRSEPEVCLCIKLVGGGGGLVGGVLVGTGGGVFFGGGGDGATGCALALKDVEA